MQLSCHREAVQNDKPTGNCFLLLGAKENCFKRMRDIKELFRVTETPEKNGFKRMMRHQGTVSCY